jgi:hypothetical protein
VQLLAQQSRQIPESQIKQAMMSELKQPEGKAGFQPRPDPSVFSPCLAGREAMPEGVKQDENRVCWCEHLGMDFMRKRAILRICKSPLGGGYPSQNAFECENERRGELKGVTGRKQTHGEGGNCRV